MYSLNRYQQATVGLVLVLFMILTRGPHAADLMHLPDASWAVFFLAGMYLRPVMLFPVLLGLAGALDFAAIRWGGVSDFCITSAYGFLLPAYGSLWLAGRRYGFRHCDRPATLLPLAGYVFAGVLAGEIFSSGGFYFFGGRFADPSLAGFGGRLLEYFPASLASLAFYLALAVLIHAAFIAAPQRQSQASE